MFPNLLKIMKITNIFSFSCVNIHLQINTWPPWMPAVISALYCLLCYCALTHPPSSSLAFLMGFTPHWKRSGCCCSSLLISVLSLCFFFTLLYLFLLLPFCFDITNFLGFNEKVKDITDEENNLQINQLIIVLWISSNRLQNVLCIFLINELLWSVWSVKKLNPYDISKGHERFILLGEISREQLLI